MVKPWGRGPNPNGPVSLRENLGTQGHRGTCTEKRSQEDTVIKRPSARQGERPRKQPNVPIRCTWTSAPRTVRQYTSVVQGPGLWYFAVAAVGMNAAVDGLWRLGRSTTGVEWRAESEQGGPRQRTMKSHDPKVPLYAILGSLGKPTWLEGEPELVSIFLRHR